MQQGTVKDLEELCAVDPLVHTFCDLISYDTKSDGYSDKAPSTVGQLRLGAMVVSKLRDLGYDARQDERGVVTAKVSPSKGAESAPALALIAHLDTAPDASGAGVTPHLVKQYAGGGIELKNGLVLDDAICPELPLHYDEDIIVTSGETLLGADDKAGVAAIMHLLKDLSLNPEIPHPKITAVFSVDEEIGRSADYIDLKQVGCDYGVTVDGGEVGELSVETFNAQGAIVSFTGRSVHTAVAYKTMINAVSLASRFIALLPPQEKPENTRAREGFYHVHNIEGSVDHAELRMILRDFDESGLDARAKVIDDIAAFLNREAGFEAVKVEHFAQYRNMAQVLREHPQIVSLCKRAYEKAGIVPALLSVRGGTDGSNLSNRGLPCPNLFTGALNCHGPYECLPVPSLHKAYEVVRALAELGAAETHEERR